MRVCTSVGDGEPASISKPLDGAAISECAGVSLLLCGSERPIPPSSHCEWGGSLQASFEVPASPWPFREFCAPCGGAGRWVEGPGQRPLVHLGLKQPSRVGPGPHVHPA